MGASSFGLVDWVAVGIFVVLTLLIGIVAHRRIATHDDFLVMGRRLRPLWGIATLSATEMGLVTVVYFSEEAYAHGFVALTTAFIAAGTMWLIGRTGFVIKNLRALELRTVPEYFAVRYSQGVRLVAGIATFLTGILNLGIFLQVEGRFLVTMFGLPVGMLPWVMGILLVIVVGYTMLGGMYSVVLTDVLQFAVMAISITAVTALALHYAGGLQGMVEAVESQYGSAGFRLGETAEYGFFFVIWTLWYYLSGWSSWQPVVQRTLSMQSTSTALKLFRLSSFFMLLRASLPMVWGIAALAILGAASSSQTALPEMLIRILPTGLMGLVVVGFLAASMSTYDSYLLSFSAILVQDIGAPLSRRPLDDKARMFWTRMGILLIALFIYAWGVYYTFTDTVFRYITLTGSISYAGIITGLVCGMYWKRANTTGAYAAFLLSAIPPLLALALPELSATHAGLLSFTLAPIGFFLGTLYGRKK